MEREREGREEGSEGAALHDEVRMRRRGCSCGEASGVGRLGSAP